MTFIGYELTSSGLRPDQRKIKAIEEMPIPADKSALQRFLGYATFLANEIMPYLTAHGGKSAQIYSPSARETIS